MRALDLNLATRPFKNNTMLWVGHGLTAALLVAFTVTNVLGYRNSRHKLSELTTTIVNIEQENRDLETREQRARRGIGRFDLKFLEVQAAKANEIIGWKAFSWTRLFNRMAEIQPHGVKMVSIRPVLRSAREARTASKSPDRADSVPVLVEGIARSFNALWEFQKVLLASEYFGRVEPERLNRGEAERNEVLFELRFEYYPGEDVVPSEPVAADEAVQVVADVPSADAAPTAPVPEESPAEPAAAEPPRRQLPPVIDDGEAPEEEEDDQS